MSVALAGVETMELILALLLSLDPAAPPQTVGYGAAMSGLLVPARVSLEVNSFGRDRASHQVIYRDPKSREILGWQWFQPELIERGIGGYIAWKDSRGTTCIIEPVEIYHTSTAHDVEVVERNVLPCEKRRGFAGRKWP